MRDNRKCITISLPASTWSHCFVGTEANSGSDYGADYITAILINVVGKRRQAYATRPKGSMGRNHQNNKST